MTKYPEAEKLSANHSHTIMIFQFLEHLNERGILLARYSDNGNHLFPIRTSFQSVVYDFFAINEQKLEEERRAMIEELRKSNEQKASSS